MKKYEKIDLEKEMTKDYSYPEYGEDKMQAKLYRKRELYYNRAPERPDIKNYEDIRKYREDKCGGTFDLADHQKLIRNLINPNTPYKGLLIYHGLGTGKCLHPDSMIEVNGSIQKIEDIYMKYADHRSVVNDNEGTWYTPARKLLVKSYNENNIVTGNVIKLYTQYISSKVKTVKLENGMCLVSTMKHRILTSEGWKLNPKIGDSVFVYDRKSMYQSSVIDVYLTDYSGHVYDLEVEKYHNYVAEGIITHNTCAGVAAAEEFIPLVDRYKTKIHILVPSAMLKESWKDEIIKCSGNAYLTTDIKLLSKSEKRKEKKLAKSRILKYYKIMTKQAFTKRVIGERISEKVIGDGENNKTIYRKNEYGEFERDIAIDRIDSLDNTLLIIDEAHNLGQGSGEAIRKILDNSNNLKILLMTATPMGNLAPDIIELLNFLRPNDSPLIKNKVFIPGKVEDVELRPGGLEYFKKMAKGYISHVRGSDPLTFAERIDKGELPPKVNHIRMTRCKMSKFQELRYEVAVKESGNAGLEQITRDASNIVYPILSQEGNGEIIGISGKAGLNILMNQIKSNKGDLNKAICNKFFKSGCLDMVDISSSGSNITGDIFKFPYIKIFSTKYYKALKNINRLIWGKKGAKTAFIYSNIVTLGVETFKEILLRNGYLEYQDETSNYQINANTVCYYCGKTFSEHTKSSLYKPPKILNTVSENIDISEDSPNYTSFSGKIPDHDFRPATFITVTGGNPEEGGDAVPSEKKAILDSVYSSPENRNGKLIKIVIGSPVMNEGISLKNVGEVHVLDVHYNIAKLDQAIGRAIRHCSHQDVISEKNMFPKVQVYKYVASLGNKRLTVEEDMYRKGEQKYILIKKIERAMKEVAIDCPLNHNSNIFKEEVERYKNCGQKGKEPCPAKCDFTECRFKCDEKILNNKYYDPNRNIYKQLDVDKLDHSTFTEGLARGEISYAKERIKELYITRAIYSLDEIIDYVKSTYKQEKIKLFDEFFVYKALDELIPITENEFNNFKDPIIDRFSRQGYLIYVDNYYIFQPFELNTKAPIYYRSNYNRDVNNNLSLKSFMLSNPEYKEVLEKKNKNKRKVEYDFKSVMEYYNTRDEFKYVGILDVRPNGDKEDEIFKIREKRSKILDKRRGVGIQSLKGAVCNTSKNRHYLVNIAKKIGLKDIKSEYTRSELCDMIKSRMLYLEKYSTDKDENKYTYIMIPADHPVYPNPYNLEDRVETIKKRLMDEIDIKFSIKKETYKKTEGEEKGMPSYMLKIEDTKEIRKYQSIIEKNGAKLEKGVWIIRIQ